jgi:hypothetical protein
MPNRKPVAPWNFVPHPRYERVVPSGFNVPEKEIRTFWGYEGETIFPESAIPANTSRQKYSVFPRRYYVDILKHCRGCSRPFLFFAREQQHWYEELGFTIDADCVRCVECRKSDQSLRRTFKHYSENIERKDLDDKEFTKLIEDAVLLSDAGILQDEQRLRRLRNLARRRIPDSPALASIDSVISSIQTRD